MKRMDVVKKGSEWKAESGGQTVRGTKAPRKADAVKQTAAKARAASEPVSVRIHNENGRIQEERTYPRSADPRKSGHIRAAPIPGRAKAESRMGGSPAFVQSRS
jgi:hypothetical protein